MKTIYTLLISFISLVSVNNSIQAQCISPDLKFANPTLVSGTALAEGATYKFPNVTTGVDCFIKLLKLNGGAKLISMETPGQGYPDAWQPIIDGPGTPAGNKSWIDWEISFKTNAGGNYAFTCLDITAIDVDGDNGSIGEFVESAGHANYSIPNPTLLTLTDKGSGRLEAQAPITNRPSIDTSAMDVRIGFFYNSKGTIQLKLGSKVSGGSGGATQRLNCIYFKRMTLSAYVILPVKFVSFDAVAFDQKVDLNWLTDNEVNNSHFEVERSFDGKNFSTIAIVLDALTAIGSNKNYKMSDRSTDLAGKVFAYYRLKQVDVKGMSGYSNVVSVKLLANKTTGMTVSPNPFRDNLSIRFTASENGKGVLMMYSLTGQSVTTTNVIVTKGDNKGNINGLGNLPNGVYLAQIIVNGKVISNQKVIKGL